LLYLSDQLFHGAKVKEFLFDFHRREKSSSYFAMEFIVFNFTTNRFLQSQLQKKQIFGYKTF